VVLYGVLFLGVYWTLRSSLKTKWLVIRNKVVFSYGVLFLWGSLDTKSSESRKNKMVAN